MMVPGWARHRTLFSGWLMTGENIRWATWTEPTGLVRAAHGASGSCLADGVFPLSLCGKQAAGAQTFGAGFVIGIIFRDD